MYILKNAWKSIIRNKGRNILLIIIALAIAISACVALSIREAAETAKEDTLGKMSITASLSYDRASAMENYSSGSSQGGGSRWSFDRDNFDFSSIRGNAVTLDDYLNYAALLSEQDGYYYSQMISMNAAKGLLPYGVNEKESSGSGSSFLDRFSGMGGRYFSDFRVTGYSSYDAMIPLFGEDGTYTMVSGTVFDEGAPDLACIISDELAMYNDLQVGDTITLSNSAKEEETYTLKVTGIYHNAAADSEAGMFSTFDPANNIYMNATALGTILDKASANGADSAIAAQTTFTYVLSSLESYEAFKTAAEAEGLPKNYTISSTDASAYEKSVTPLTTLGTMTGWFFLIVLVIGGVILVVLNIFNLRERKYEIGVLTAIGMKKSKVAVQFICELLIVTFTAIIVGVGVGAAISVPVTNTLLEQQIEKAEASEESVSNNFGFSGGTSGNWGNFGSILGNRFNQQAAALEPSYVTSVSSATNLTVILQMVLVGLFLTIVSSLAANPHSDIEVFSLLI